MLIDAIAKSIVSVQRTMGVIIINALQGTVNLMHVAKCCVQVIVYAQYPRLMVH